MDIRSWPIDKIMQLPDCCFGRRWLVGVYSTDVALGTYYDISEAGLGDRCVVWNLMANAGTSTAGITEISIALGDVLPTTDAEFDALAPLFSDLGRRDADRRALVIGAFAIAINLTMKLPVMAQGRRLVGRFEVLGVEIATPQVIMEVSSFPTEVPDWLISGRGRGL